MYFVERAWKHFAYVRLVGSTRIAIFVALIAEPEVEKIRIHIFGNLVNKKVEILGWDGGSNILRWVFRCLSVHELHELVARSPNWLG